MKMMTTRTRTRQESNRPSSLSLTWNIFHLVREKKNVFLLLLFHVFLGIISVFSNDSIRSHNDEIDVFLQHCCVVLLSSLLFSHTFVVYAWLCFSCIIFSPLTKARAMNVSSIQLGWEAQIHETKKCASSFFFGSVAFWQGVIEMIDTSDIALEFHSADLPALDLSMIKGTFSSFKAKLFVWPVVWRDTAFLLLLHRLRSTCHSSFDEKWRADICVTENECRSLSIKDRKKERERERGRGNEKKFFVICFSFVVIRLEKIWSSCWTWFSFFFRHQWMSKEQRRHFSFSDCLLRARIHVLYFSLSEKLVYAQKDLCQSGEKKKRQVLNSLACHQTRLNDVLSF